MDEIDFKINLLLMINSRLSYREIAEHLGLTVNAVYKRVQALIDLGIIQKFRTRIKPYAVNAIYSFIFGKCEISDLKQVTGELGKHENTAQIMLSSRNHLYLGAYLRNINELDNYTAFISKTAKITNPTIGFLHRVFSSSPISYSIPKSLSLNLDDLDFAIIRSLHNDSRKSISEVSDEVSRTPNTVRRRLSRLLDDGIIDLTIDFNPISSNDIFSLFQIELKPSADKNKLGQFIIDTFKPHIFFCWTFSNLPNLITCFVWCNSMKQLHDMIEKLKKEEIESIIPDVLYEGLFYDTWMDKLYSL